MQVSPTQSQIQTALRSFLVTVLPVGVECIEGQDNRVPEPQGADFVVMTTIRRPRLETNIDTPADVVFTGAIAGTTLTVSAVEFGTIIVGAQLFGAGIAPNTAITAQGSGRGGTGTYTVAPSQTVSSEAMAAGTLAMMQPTEIVVQLDFHSANVSDSADMAQAVATAFRDEYAVNQFATSGFAVTPLYADDPRQVPFINAEQQYETRWIVDVHMQANQTVTVPQKFAGSAAVDVISVDASYPPS